MEQLSHTDSNLLILTDPGIDDAIALFYLFDYHIAHNIFVAPVAGNVDLNQAHHNVSRLCYYHPGPRRPITQISTKPLQQQDDPHPEYHGYDGLGDILPHPFLMGHAWTSFTNLFTNNYSTILSLGPPLVLTKLLDELSHKPSHIIQMGGRIHSPGNYKDRFEFNFGLNREATTTLINRPEPITLLPLDCTTYYDITSSDIPSINPPSIYSFFVRRLLKRQLQLRHAMGKQIIHPHDFLAALYLTHPEYFNTSHVTLQTNPDYIDVTPGGSDTLVDSPARPKDFIVQHMLHPHR